MCERYCRESCKERGKVNMKVNIKETLDFLDSVPVKFVKSRKPKNSTFTVHKTTSVRNYLKTCGK